jgi:dolichol-phosphate mannosyltransferase
VPHEALPRLSGIGFKILIDLCASAPRRLRYKEIPYEFRLRQAGTSKLDSQVAWEYVMLLLDKLIGRWLPPRFITFSMVGATGLIVHLTIIAILYQGLKLEFTISQAIATLVAMTGNFLLNNVFTYYDRRLRGWRLFTGWAKFVLACGVGVMANVSVARYIFYQHWLSWAPSAIAGALVSVVWNYAVTGFYTWNSRQKQ